jgi:hypothetical protein
MGVQHPQLALIGRAHLPGQDLEQIVIVPASLLVPAFEATFGTLFPMFAGDADEGAHEYGQEAVLQMPKA